MNCLQELELRWSDLVRVYYNVGHNITINNMFHDFTTNRGSLLFLIYINDIPSQMVSTCRLYADDCILYRQIETHMTQLSYKIIY